MNIDLMIKTLSIMLGLFVLSKVLGPFLLDFFKQNPKNNNHDIDEMIKRKVDYMRVTGVASTTTNNSVSTSKAPSSKNDYNTEIKNLFQTLSSEKNKDELTRQKLVDLKRILALLDSLQWGQSEEITVLRKKFETNFNISVEPEKFIHAIRLSLIHAPLADGKKILDSYDDFSDYICSIVMNVVIVSSFTDSNDQHAKNMAKRWHSDVETLQRAWLYWTYDLMPNKSPSFLEELVRLAGPISAQEMMQLCGHGPHNIPWSKLISDNKRPRRGNELASQMRERLALMQAIKQLPESNNITHEEALNLLGFDAIPAPGVLSRRYKRLARLMHPDHLESRGFPATVMNRVNENFKTLKAAYDLLKQESEN